MAQRTKPLILMMATTIQARQLREQLRDAGFRVMEVPPDDVVGSFLDFMPGLVLLEYASDQAPVEDAAQRIRDTDAGSAVPIYLFGAGTEPNPIEVVTMGADLYIHLPVEPEWLTNKLSYLGGIKEARSSQDSDAEPSQPRGIRAPSEQSAPRQSTQSAVDPNPNREQRRQDQPLEPKGEKDDRKQNRTDQPNVSSEKKKAEAFPEPSDDGDLFDPAQFDPNDFSQDNVVESGSFLMSEQEFPNSEEVPASAGVDSQDDRAIFGSLDDSIDVASDAPEIDLHALDVETTIPGIPPDDLVDVDEPLDAALHNLSAEERSDEKDWVNSHPGMDPELQEQIETSQASIPRVPVSEEEIEASRSFREEESLSHWSAHSVTGPSQVSVHRVTFVSAHGQRDTTEVISEDRISGNQDTVVGLKWKTQQNDIDQLEEKLADEADSAKQDGKAQNSTPKRSRGDEEHLPVSHGSASKVDRQDRMTSKPQNSSEVTADERPKEEKPGDDRQEGAQDRQAPSEAKHAELLDLPITGKKPPSLPVDLAEHSPLDVLMSLASTRHSGWVRFTRHKTRIDLLLEKGRLTAGTSSSEDLSLAARLVRVSQLTSSHVETVRSLSEQRGITFEKALLQGGFIAQAALAVETSRYVRSLLYEVGRWRQGRADWLDASEEAVRLRDPVDWAEAVLETLRRSWTDDQALSALAEREARPVWRSPDHVSLFVTRMDLTPSEIRAIRLFGQGFEFDEAARRSDLPPADLARILHAALFLGLLVDPRDRPQEAIEVGTRSVPVPSPDVRDEIHRERILAKLEQVREADYLALLGLEPGVGPYVVKKAYEELRHTFSDEALPATVAKEMADELALIRQVLSEAMAVLTHEKYAELYQAAVEHHPMT
ncbi:MAG: hypothetical protein J7M25_04680 [Deltaproteobacteria bacterium]|nr:hypothetical protein [Deltaproteobacteria bacterium]